jgi:sugar transferase (PEP-CTERM/EpsH1 system associated)
VNTPIAVVTAGAAQKKEPPLIAHIVHRFAVGGLENGLVNLINATATDRYRHAIVSLTDCTDFRSRIREAHVPVITLHKRGGKDFRTHFRLWRVLQELRPAIVHTRNLPALEFLSVAALAGVPGRIHGEHGRDMYDLDGSSRKYNLLRKGINPFVSCYTTVSNDLSRWLVQTVGIASERVIHICNGVDVHRFYPRSGARPSLGPEGFVKEGTVFVGTVGRMQTVKDQLTLVQAFIHLVQRDREAREHLRLIMIGDGPLRENAQKLIADAEVGELAWLPGERNDIPGLLRAFDLFILPSIAEGISNTILEAMATGLPVIATGVGGNPELVVHGQTGMLVPPCDPIAMANAIRTYIQNPDMMRPHGQAARKRAVEHFSIEKMVNGYLDVYDEVLAERGRRRGRGLEQRAERKGRASIERTDNGGLS